MRLAGLWCSAWRQVGDVLSCCDWTPRSDKADPKAAGGGGGGGGAGGGGGGGGGPVEVTGTGQGPNAHLINVFQVRRL